MKKRVILISTILFIIDLLSKIIVTNTLKINQEITIIKKFFNITYVTNDGAAFSLLSGNTIIFILIGLLVIYYIFKHILNEKISKLQLVSYSLLLGGIIGNLFDRVIYHKVIDFLSFKIFNYQFPIFNLADTFITIGTILIIIDILKGETNNENRSRKK